MSIKRITVSVPATVAAQIKKAAGRTPVSAWVTEVLEERLADEALERAWEAFVRDVAPSRAESRRADAIFKRITKAPPKRSVA